MTEDMKKMEQRSDAWMIIAEMGRQHNETEERNDKKYKMLFKITILILCMWFATIGGFFYYFFNTESSTYSYALDSEGEGVASFFGNDGVLNYGEGASDQSNTETEK